MAQNKQPTPHVRSIFSWFRRHKITAVFAVFVSALALYLGVSAVVLQVQIRVERDHFMATDSQMRHLRENLVSSGEKPSASYYDRHCSYTHTEIEMPSRSCDIAFYLSYSSPTPDEILNRTTAIIRKEVKLSKSQNPAYSDGNIATYDFILDGNVSCFVDYWIIKNSITQLSSIHFKLNAKDGVVMEVSCGGGARAEYFPVTQD